MIQIFFISHLTCLNWHLKISILTTGWDSFVGTYKQK